VYTISIATVVESNEDLQAEFGAVFAQFEHLQKNGIVDDQGKKHAIVLYLSTDLKFSTALRGCAAAHSNNESCAWCKDDKAARIREEDYYKREPSIDDKRFSGSLADLLPFIPPSRHIADLLHLLLRIGDCHVHELFKELFDLYKSDKATSLVIEDEFHRCGLPSFNFFAKATTRTIGKSLSWPSITGNDYEKLFRTISMENFSLLTSTRATFIQSIWDAFWSAYCDIASWNDEGFITMETVRDKSRKWLRLWCTSPTGSFLSAYSIHFVANINVITMFLF